MKGVVFDILRDMIEEKFGLEGWNQLLEKAGSDGMYLSSESYDDSEMVSLLGAASEMTGIEVPQLLQNFGEFMVGEFYTRFPIFFDNCSGLVDFLKSVDEIVHGEVLKFYPDANLPKFDYDERGDSLVMIYQSQRKLCYLAEGLMAGSAKHFKQNVEIEQTRCMHRGDDNCHIVIKVSND
ncbi:heme NO-binding domain-containing protein [Thalassolituus maritimus]|uniref:Heme NO-binding domain-containing protein n=1 Tax=Thalassolituus maritimus TaxID=484498 RepID=A0ABQ0A399_9GAMM